MKKIFIPAKSKERLNKDLFLKEASVLPRNLAIFYSIQYEPLAKEIKFALEKAHKVVKFTQVLGCSKVSIPKQAKGVLLVGSGNFHVLGLALNSNLPIYIYKGNKIEKVSEKEVALFKNSKKTAQIKFLKAEKVGVLVSTKPGQENLMRALKIGKIKKKQLYFFIGDSLPPAEFENFGLESWINTACPRLDLESDSIINIEDLQDFKNKP